MSRNSVKQMIVFPSEAEKETMLNAIKDRVEITGRGLSAELIAALERGIYPPNGTLAAIMKDVYEGRDSLNKAIAKVFEYMSYGDDWDALYENGLPLIDFCISKFIESNTRIVRTRADMNDLIRNWDSICTRLEKYAKRDRGDQAQMQIDADDARIMLTELKIKDARIEAYPYFKIIRRHWESFCSWSVTFRFLSGMLYDCEDWPPDAKSRVDVIEIMTSMSLEWKQIDEQRKHKADYNKAARSRAVSIQDGQLFIPEDWVIINPDDALTSREALVIEIDGVKQLVPSFGPIPHFVYLTNEEKCDRELENEIIEKAAKLWPPLSVIWAVHIDVSKFDLAKEECVAVYSLIPKAGVFRLPVKGSTVTSDIPYGACILRNR